MSNFYCEHCNTEIKEGPDGRYVSGCPHYPIEEADPRQPVFTNLVGNATIERCTICGTEKLKGAMCPECFSNSFGPGRIHKLPEDVHTRMLKLHVKALSAHCEALGMNAENMISAINNWTPPYGNQAYMDILQKWGLVDEKGEPTI